MIKCSFGTAPRFLIVLPKNKVNTTTPHRQYYGQCPDGKYHALRNVQFNSKSISGVRHVACLGYSDTNALHPGHNRTMGPWLFDCACGKHAGP